MQWRMRRVSSAWTGPPTGADASPNENAQQHSNQGGRLLFHEDALYFSAFPQKEPRLPKGQGLSPDGSGVGGLSTPAGVPAATPERPLRSRRSENYFRGRARRELAGLWRRPAVHVLAVRKFEIARSNSKAPACSAAAFDHVTRADGKSSGRRSDCELIGNLLN